LGIGGRRILVSRDWSGKTLADHKADQHAWVRQVLALGLGHQQPNDASQGAADGGHDQGDEHNQRLTPGAGVVRVWWQRADPRDRDVKPLHQRLWRALGQRIRWRAEWHAARDRLANQSGPPPTAAHVSATQPEGGWS
jgi:hypothetical protein